MPGFTSLKRRNVQVDPSAAKAIGDSAVSSSDNEEENPWKCPYCSFVQKNKRGPDFRRHVATHIGDKTEKKRFLCCGVPFFDAAEHNVPQEIMHNPLSMNELDGMLMVGGHWDRPFYPGLSRSYSTSSFNSYASSTLEDEDWQRSAGRREGMYGWVRKGAEDWRVIWLGDASSALDDSFDDDE